MAGFLVGSTCCTKSNLPLPTRAPEAPSASPPCTLKSLHLISLCWNPFYPNSNVIIHMQNRGEHICLCQNMPVEILLPSFLERWFSWGPRSKMPIILLVTNEDYKENPSMLSKKKCKYSTTIAKNSLPQIFHLYQEELTKQTTYNKP